MASPAGRVARVTPSPARPPIPAHRPADRAGRQGTVLALQGQAGNRATAALVGLLGPASAGLPLSSPLDPDEREARRAATDLTADGVVGPAEARTGDRLGPASRAFFEARLGAGLGGVRIHTGALAEQAAGALSARAVTVGQHVLFAPGQYQPGTAAGQRLLAHELVHAAQQGDHPAVIHRDGPALASGTIRLDQYSPPNDRSVYRVGDTAAYSVLMKIEQNARGSTTFFWFNFHSGETGQGSWRDWDFRVGAATLGLNSDDYAGVGRAISPARWAQLWPDPRPELLKLYEQGKLSMPDDAVLSTYGGLIHNEALRTLDENEKAIDALLAQPNRVAFFARYAQGLREASVVRDALEVRQRALAGSEQQMQGFSFGMAGRVVGMNPARRLNQSRERGAVEQTLAFWRSAFPLLSRLRTAEISGTAVEATLLAIKRNIIEVRPQVALAVKGKGSLKLWDLDNARAKVDAGLGPKAKAVIEAEEKSRRRWGWVKAAAGLAAGIALLFIPGGAFIDVAIGVAMGVEAIDRARTLGQAANTGMDVDAGLVSQAAARAAEFEAVLAGIFAVLGAAGMGLRVLRVSRMLLRVREAAPALELAAQVRIARVLAGNQTWLRAGADLGELNRAILQAGSRLRFEELRILRGIVYEAQGAALPAHSAESLAEMLQVVWSRRAQILGRAEREEAVNDVYRIYNAATEANPLTKPSAQYLGEVADIARGRPAGAISNIQNGGERILDLVAARGFSGTRVEKTFYRFVRPGANLSEVGERVYLNVQANNVPSVMKTVVKDIIDNPAQFPGARMAKMSGPRAVSGRAESIVVYVTDAAQAQRVVARMRTYQAANPGQFMSSTPRLTEQLAEGVSVGSQPLARFGDVSFGQLRSGAIYDALAQTVRHGQGAEEFARAVAAQLRRAGVNPDAPHLNLSGATQ